MGDVYKLRTLNRLVHVLLLRLYSYNQSDFISVFHTCRHAWRLRQASCRAASRPDRIGLWSPGCLYFRDAPTGFSDTTMRGSQSHETLTILAAMLAAKSKYALEV